MRFRYIAIGLLAIAACKGPAAKEVPVWDYGEDSDNPSAGPSASDEPEPSEEPVIEVQISDIITLGKASATDCSIAAEYSFKEGTATDGLKYGLCWGTRQSPNILQDNYMYGPQLDEGGKAFQVIPDVLPPFGNTYNVRAFVTSGSTTEYTDVIKVSMKPAPEPIKLEWKKLVKGALPDGIELFETTSTLDGKNVHAWYAVADMEKVEFRVSIPSEPKTIDDQIAEARDCFLMINGGYFYNGRNTGMAVINGVPSGNIPAVRGSLRTADTEYNVMYNVTRGAFGVDDGGTPSVYWAGGEATGAGLRFYDRPLPSVRGKNRYPTPSETLPWNAAAWKPRYALSAGPVLLKNGRIAFNFDETEDGGEYYLNNFEIMPYDIFGPESVCDRTAVGYTAEGKVVFFTCDGRVKGDNPVPGLNLLELARIMAGIGCVEAVNFDGGGSTGMMVGTAHLGDQTAEVSRKVLSTMGFYKLDPSSRTERSEIPQYTDMVLVYGYSHHRKPYLWSEDIMKYYVEYDDPQGKKHWLFDAFLCLDFMDADGPDGNKTFVTGYQHNGSYLESANKQDWAKMIDYYFQESTGAGAIDRAVATAKKTLGEPPHKRQIVVGIPEPIQYRFNNYGSNQSGGTTYWGDIDGKTMDFSKASDRLAAMKWFVDTVCSKFKERAYQNIELGGFYIVAERSDFLDDLLPPLGEYISSQHYSFNWIPYFKAHGYYLWKEYGFTYAFMQPNYFFDASIPESRLKEACEIVVQNGMGMEIEFDGNALETSERKWGGRLRDYMRYAQDYGVWEKSKLAYYQGAWAVKWLKDSSNSQDQQLYNDFCQWMIERPLRDSH
ncbi:MAG: DUF4855 domain-containing protein [Bacteroidales bacterium]|nr:DUF4855 domain-containing protein [Bacteroidales bacterium]